MDVLWIVVRSVGSAAATVKDGVSHANAQLLEGASGCAVSSSRNLVFVGGSQPQRDRARRYLRWMTEWRLEAEPGVVDLTTAADIAEMTVRRGIVARGEFSDEMDAVARDHGAIWCFDGWADERKAAAGAVGHRGRARRASSARCGDDRRRGGWKADDGRAADSGRPATGDGRRRTTMDGDEGGGGRRSTKLTTKPTSSTTTT